jgi:hypothetical protein
MTPFRTDRMDAALRRKLKPLKRRLRLYDGHRWVVRTLWVAVLPTVLILLAGRLLPLAGYNTWAWIPPALWLFGVLGYSLLRRLPAMRVARRTDVALGLRDRLATALELNYETPKRGAAFDSRLVARQHADALDAIDGIDPATVFPLRRPWRPLAAAAVGLLAALFMTYLPNPMDAVLADRAAVAARAEEEAEELEALASELAGDESLDPEATEDLIRRLREAAEELRANPGDREEALADLAELEAQMRRQLDPQNVARQAALEGLAADLTELAGATDSNPSLDEAARLLQELAGRAGEMSPAEQEALARALEQAAARLAGSDPTLAGTLSRLAQDVRAGEAGQASKSGRQAAEGIRQAATDAAMQEALARALNQTQDSSAAVARAGQSTGAGDSESGGQAQAGGQSGQGQGQGQNSGQGASSGQGQGQSQSSGQGQGQGQGASGGGGGTTASSGPPSTRSGRAGEPTDPNEDYDVGELDTVFAPWQRGQPGDPDFLPGRQTGQGQETVRENQQPQPGASGAASVPYDEVYPSYAAAAAESMEREYVPSGLRDYVRDYFSHLEP